MKILYLTISSLFVFSATFGQEAVLTAGGIASNTYGSVSYSIGQIAYQSVSNTSGAVNQGVQQPYVISTLRLEETDYNLSLSAYPNPTTEHLILRVGNFNQEKLSYKMFDVEGGIIKEDVIVEDESVLLMRGLPAATYFVEVHRDGKKVQIFKILKNQ